MALSESCETWGVQIQRGGSRSRGSRNGPNTGFVALTLPKWFKNSSKHHFGTLFGQVLDGFGSGWGQNVPVWTLGSSGGSQKGSQRGSKSGRKVVHMVDINFWGPKIDFEGGVQNPKRSQNGQIRVFSTCQKLALRGKFFIVN